jgi:hypothetical protein
MAHGGARFCRSARAVIVCYGRLVARDAYSRRRGNAGSAGIPSGDSRRGESDETSRWGGTNCLLESATFLAYLAEPNSRLAAPIVDWEALLPFAVCSQMIEIVEHFGVSTHAPVTLGGDPQAISPSPAIPGAANTNTLFSQ